MGSDIFAKFSAYIKNSRKEANTSKQCGRGAAGPGGRDASVCGQILPPCSEGSCCPPHQSLPGKQRSRQEG